jgi:type 1 glutamine amidotransferase
MLNAVFAAALFLAAEPPPLKALLVTGGCCHDYPRQQLIIPQGVEARTGVKWTVVRQGGTTTNTAIPLYNDPDWAKGYDLVVHNECFADVKDQAFIERILKPHREGLPAVVVHCAMHCYRAPDDKWFKFCGVRSHYHGPHYGYAVESLAADHPIMAGFPKSWAVKQGELYNIAEVYPTAKVLAHVPANQYKKPQPVVWTNEYGKGRVFGTTIGHYNSTMVDPVFLDTLTRGILWATARDPNSIRKTTPQQDEAIRGLALAAVAGKAPPAPPPGK